MFIIALITTLSIAHLGSIRFATGIELDYEELKDISGSCHPFDTCNEDRSPNTATEVSLQSTCACNRLCSKYGTCCIDSRHRKNLVPNPRPRCRTMDGKYGTVGYYMVDRCQSGGQFDSVWKSLCEADWKEEDNAVLPLAPVTSLLTSMTYKNYFCFRCYENGNDVLYWNVVLTGYYNGSTNVTKDFENEDYIVKYHPQKKTWIAFVGIDDIPIPVNMRFEIPNRVKSLSVECDPNMIDACSDDWTDDAVREKCDAYQAIMYINRENETYLTYRNPHCALCNFESMDDMRCYYGKFVVLNPTGPFNFSHSVDVNQYEGDNFLPMERKCGENLIWDPYGKKCRKILCPNPGFVVRDGTCMPRFHFPEYPPFHAFPEEHPKHTFFHNWGKSWFHY